MSRSYSIHILTHEKAGFLGAFTVKHEMETWIARQTLYKPEELDCLTVRDGFILGKPRHEVR
jgi:hypothetical protein